MITLLNTMAVNWGRIMKAFGTRVLFAAHTLFCIWILVTMKQNNNYWLMALSLLLGLAECIYTVVKRKGEESKWWVYNTREISLIILVHCQCHYAMLYCCILFLKSIIVLCYECCIFVAYCIIVSLFLASGLESSGSLGNSFIFVLNNCSLYLFMLFIYTISIIEVE